MNATIQDNFEVGLRLTSSEPSGAFCGDPISGNTTFDSNGSRKFIYVAKWNRGGFVLNEIGASSANDTSLGDAQVLVDSTWSKKISTTIGAAALGILHADSTGLNNGDVPNVTRGNTRDDPAAPSAADNYGYTVGVLFGKSGKKSTWEVGCQYLWLGSNARYEELVDSDFGALHQSARPNSGPGAGYGSGTNANGHIVRLACSPYDFVTLSVNRFYTWLITPVPTGSDSAMNRVPVDAMWKL